MKPWKSIVVAIDYSDASRAALREAARLANWYHSTLHVAHVISYDRKSEGSEGSDGDHSAAITVIRDLAEQKLKEITLSEIEFFLDIEYHIMIGNEFREIYQLTHDINADLLVLGSFGNDSKDGHHTGVIATKCVRKIPLPVFLVRKTHDNPYQDIVVATDFSETSEKAAKIAAEIAFENNSNLHLVHVYRPSINFADYAYSDMNGVMVATSYQFEIKSSEKALDDLKSKLKKSYPDLRIKTGFLDMNRVSAALSDYIDEHDAHLAVLGTRGRTGIKSILLGTTAEKIIRDCPCSVLAIKPDGFFYKI